jgi:hypothetical protein
MAGSSTTNLSDVFLGSEQSKYAGIALFITILIICLAILFTSSKIPIEQRIVFVIFILIITVPSILMSLLELTCIVTGGNYNTRWWCWALAWVLSIIIIFYCIMIIISLFISMTNYDLANERIADDLENNKVDTTTDNINANNYAKNIMNSYEKDIDNSPHLAHERQEHQQEPMLPPMSTPRQDMSSSQYLPPVPPQQQQPVPQQSQHMNVVQQVQQSSQQPMNGDYTGFDSSDNLSPLDSSFTPIKEPIRQRANVNSDPRTNETVEPYTNENEMFSSF